MVSPTYFRPALVARQGSNGSAAVAREEFEDISAIILEHSDLDLGVKRESITDISKVVEEELPDVGMKIVRKANFARVDLHNANESEPFEYLGRKRDSLMSPVVAFTDMMARAWQSKSEEMVFEHDAIFEDGMTRTKYEVKVTRLEENALVVVVRNVSERYRRFEAEKRFVFETTARQKDAEANRFTRHEVKNGLLAAIEICGNIREQLSDEVGHRLKDSSTSLRDSASFDLSHASDENGAAGRMENVAELDRTLHEVLNIVLAETMARDVIHEMYVPRLERIDVNRILTQTRGYRATVGQFALVCRPSPLPILLSDQGLFKCIHSNAVRNAIKYGKPGGKITTEATYNSEKGEFMMRVINLPGPGHDKLVAMGERASDLVFSHGTRLHKDSDMGKRSYSAGDGAWIVRKCATILRGSVSISFEADRTVFEFQAPVKVHDAMSTDADQFHLPHGVWGIGIDDSKIQRKLLRRIFLHAGVHEHHQIILGHKPEEIANFVDFVVDFVNSHPCDRFFLIADENLEMDGDTSGHETVSGSECIKQIRNSLSPEKEKMILALVRSANDSPQDLALYTSRAHGYLPKVPLQGSGVRETVSPLWKQRFPSEMEDSHGEETASEGTLSRIASLENLRDLTLISPMELLAELEQIDTLCIRNHENGTQDRWPIIWDKLHQLKGDLKSMNLDEKFNSTIQLIETLRGESHPADFMSTWLRIRSDVVSFISPT
jgi:signal transduction histidine kinase